MQRPSHRKILTHIRVTASSLVPMHREQVCCIFRRFNPHDSVQRGSMCKPLVVARCLHFSGCNCICNYCQFLSAFNVFFFNVHQQCNIRSHRPPHPSHSAPCQHRASPSCSLTRNMLSLVHSNSTGLRRMQRSDGGDGRIH